MAAAFYPQLRLDWQQNGDLETVLETLAARKTRFAAPCASWRASRRSQSPDAVGNRQRLQLDDERARRTLRGRAVAQVGDDLRVRRAPSLDDEVGRAAILV